MPYTLAHPAVVVPLRRWLALGAAVTGAMAPDVAYYLPSGAFTTWYPSTDATHSWAGAVTFDALVGLVLYAVWRWPVRPGLLGSLPSPWREAALEQTTAVLPGRSRPLRLLLLYASSAVGALSHVLLDVFTHDRPETPGVLVDEKVLGLPIASQLQRGLSALGLALLVWWLWRWAAGVAPPSTARPTRALLVLGAAVLLGAVVVTVRHLAITPTAGRTEVVVQALFGLTGGAVLGLVLACALLVVRRTAE